MPFVDSIRVSIVLCHTILLFNNACISNAFSLSVPQKSVSDNIVGSQRKFSSTFGSTARKSRCSSVSATSTVNTIENDEVRTDKKDKEGRKRIVVIGGGWGGLSAAHKLAESSKAEDVDVILIEASPKVGGLVRDGFTSVSGNRPAEAGQHGFWQNYHNIYQLLHDLPNIDIETALTDYAPQGQYSPNGLEAVWPVYRDQPLTLPTGLAQAAYTVFKNLSVFDRLTAVPLVLAFSEFDDSVEAWKKFDTVSFRDLCMRLGVSKKCYDEAFEPMILTGLFAPGSQCSAAAALGMAYFFVLKSQTSFDVQWCKGNIGETIFSPWVQTMEDNGVTFKTNTRVVGFNIDDNTKKMKSLTCQTTSSNSEDKVETTIEADEIVFAVGGEALSTMVRYSPALSKYDEYRRFVNLRGTSCLATRIFLDKTLEIPYSANACWGFDDGIGMTMFDIKALHGSSCSTVDGAPGSVIEVDYYHSSSLLVMDDDAIVNKVKTQLDTILGEQCVKASVVDAAIVRLPNAVNWYYPGSYKDMPDVKSNALHNVYFVGDIVRTRHGSWSQEKAFVTGIEAANLILKKPTNDGVIPLEKDEAHVQFGKDLVATAKQVLGRGDPSRGPSLVDFLF